MTLATQYNYAVFTEIVYGRRMWQGYALGGDEWLPVNEPRDNELDARLDCYLFYGQVVRLKLLAADEGYRLDPSVRQHEWSGTRRILK